jgi:hypothetical protein
VWPGFTKDDRWLVSYQGTLPGLRQRRAVVGLTAGAELYLAIQESTGATIGVMPASAYWVPGAYVAAPELGIHTVAVNGSPGDIPQFLLAQDPCPSTRPNWIPNGQTTPVYDPTQPPMPHEAVAQGLIAPDPLLYPGGAIRMGPAADATLASEYACLLAWFQQPGHGDKVLTAFANSPSSTDYARGAWLRAGGFVLVGTTSGYAGRPVLDVRYELAWADESTLSGEALVLSRKARRFYYPASFPEQVYSAYPGMTNPLQPGPAVGFRLGRYCPTTVTVPGCDPTTSPPARDSGVDFYTNSGLTGMSRYASGTSGGTSVTSFDKSTIPGQEYRGRVFYGSYVGNTVMMVPPGLDAGQVAIIR